MLYFDPARARTEVGTYHGCRFVELAIGCETDTSSKNSTARQKILFKKDIIIVVRKGANYYRVYTVSRTRRLITRFCFGCPGQLSGKKKQLGGQRSTIFAFNTDERCNPND